MTGWEAGDGVVVGPQSLTTYKSLLLVATLPEDIGFVLPVCECMRLERKERGL